MKQRSRRPADDDAVTPASDTDEKGSDTTRRGITGLVIVFSLFLVVGMSQPRTGELEQTKQGEQVQQKLRGAVPPTNEEYVVFDGATPEGTAEFAVLHTTPANSEPPAFTVTSLGLTLSSMGVGTYLGKTDESTDSLVEEAIITSVNSGWNVIDSAINYRGQKGERCVGRAVERLVEGNPKRRSQLFISTKAGFIPGDADVAAGVEMETWGKLLKGEPKKALDELLREDGVDGRHCISPECLQNSLSQSLRNLGLKSVDLLYLHNAAEKQLVVGRAEFMGRLERAFLHLEAERKRGRIGAYGLATWTCFRVPPEHVQYLSLEAVVQLARRAGGESHGFRYIQLPLSGDDPEAATETWQGVEGSPPLTLLQTAARLNVSVFSSRSLGLQGIQGDKPKKKGRPVSVAQQLENGRVKETENEQQQDEEEEEEALVDSGWESLQSVEGAATKALQLTRSIPGLTCALVGHKTPSHVEANAALQKQVALLRPGVALALLRALQN